MFFKMGLLSLIDEYQHSDQFGVAVMACKVDSTPFPVVDIIVEFDGTSIQGKLI